MRFCNNCGKKIENNKHFCTNCGQKNHSIANSNNSVVSKNTKLLFFGLLLLVLIISGLKIFSGESSSSSSLKNEEERKIYEKAVNDVKKANYIEAKIELEKIKNPSKSIKEDIEMTVQLFGIRNGYNTPGASDEDTYKIMEERLNNFNNKFKNNKSEIRKVSEDFLNETKKFIELLKLYVSIENFEESKDIDSAKEAFEKMKKLDFKLPRINNIANSKINTAESAIKIMENFKSRENNENNNLNLEKMGEGIDTKVGEAESNEDIDKEYSKWSNRLIQNNPNTLIFKEEGRWIAEIDGQRYAVIYDYPGQVRLVNATSNIFVDY